MMTQALQLHNVPYALFVHVLWHCNSYQANYGTITEKHDWQASAGWNFKAIILCFYNAK